MIKVLFSNQVNFLNEIEIINQDVVCDDIDYFHLNKPQFDYNQLKDFIGLIDEYLHYKIVIHSHFSLIKEFDLAGIHLNSADLNQLAYADEIDKCFIQPMVLNTNRIEINRVVPNMVTYSGDSFKEINELPFKVGYAFLNFDFDEGKDVLKESKTKILAINVVGDFNEEDLSLIGYSGYVKT